MRCALLDGMYRKKVCLDVQDHLPIMIIHFIVDRVNFVSSGLIKVNLVLKLHIDHNQI